MARENGDETMMRARVLCNFCEFCRYEQTPQEQDHEALSMESELKRLRLLTRRITGKDLDGLSFPELQLIESRLKHVFQIVKNQKTQVELEEGESMRNQKKQAANEVGIGRGPLVPCNFSGISSEERPQKHDDEAPLPVSAVQREFKRRLAEPMESEFERLWLLNERMNGRKLEGMTLFELLILEGQILDSMHRVKDQKLGPRTEQMARQRKELWRKVLSKLGMTQLIFASWADFITWLSASAGSSSLTLKRLVAQTLIFHIWKERNNRLHNSISSPHGIILKQVDRSIRNSILPRIHRKSFWNLFSLWFTYE